MIDHTRLKIVSVVIILHLLQADDLQNRVVRVFSLGN